ncbi:hypothetical protein CXG50_05945 [Pseudomonas plecoglossicida]|nr:hypothetical protein CX682_27040 [Pseudomonas sp. FFUP_PS_41]PLU99444.1 hypothetical protein CXG52_07325 [Pseudomonas plecoglossicida]PLV10717.1 hypothetical protein CXG50_05945 [Pseudomonas plecoglossicida]
MCHLAASLWGNCPVPPALASSPAASSHRYSTGFSPCVVPVGAGLLAMGCAAAPRFAVMPAPRWL